VPTTVVAPRGFACWWTHGLAFYIRGIALTGCWGACCWTASLRSRGMSTLTMVRLPHQHPRGCEHPRHPVRPARAAVDGPDLSREGQVGAHPCARRPRALRIVDSDVEECDPATGSGKGVTPASLPSLSTSTGAAFGGLLNPLKYISHLATKVSAESRQVSDLYAPGLLIVELCQHVPANASGASNVNNSNPLLPHQPREMTADHGSSHLVLIVARTPSLAAL